MIHFGNGKKFNEEKVGRFIMRDSIFDPFRFAMYSKFFQFLKKINELTGTKDKDIDLFE